MRVDLFDFELPPERIALRPARPRDSARLLLVDGARIADRVEIRDSRAITRASRASCYFEAEAPTPSLSNSSIRCRATFCPPALFQSSSPYHQ